MILVGASRMVLRDEAKDLCSFHGLAPVEPTVRPQDSPTS